MALLSPGIEVIERDASLVVPIAGSSFAVYCGIFPQGPSDIPVLITSVQELIDTFGKPTNTNYNDWFQIYSFLQYSNTIYVTRVGNGTTTQGTNASARYTEAIIARIFNGLFYGGNSELSMVLTTLLSPTGTSLQMETEIGSSMQEGAGANVGVNALFIGNRYDAGTAIILSPVATMVGLDVFVSSATTTRLAGVSINNTNALFYGGYIIGTATYSNLVNVLSSTATTLQASTYVGSSRAFLAGANVGTNALFHGGRDVGGITNLGNINTILTPTGTLFQAENNVGIERLGISGGSAGTNALFLGGDNVTIELISPTGTLLQSTTVADDTTDTQYGAAASVGTTDLCFFGGLDGVCGGSLDRSLVLSPTATQLYVEASVGTARYFLAGASV